MRILPLAVAVAFVSSCSGTKAPPPPPPAKIHTTYKVIGGVSMGGIGTAALGFQHPERFDGMGMLGGPLDAAFFFRLTDKFLLSGFCTKAQLEAALANDPNSLNDPTVMDACAQHTTPMKWEHAEDFNHWHYTLNGGSFDRTAYGHLVSDLTLGFGNFFAENPDSPYAMPGIDPEHVRHPPADFCTNPVRVQHVYNAEYNPDGTYDAITFCDGEQNHYYCLNTKTPVDFCSDPANKVSPLPQSMEQAFANTFCASMGGAKQANKNDDPLYMIQHAGVHDPCRESNQPSQVMLAYDYNGNGRRDYGEPLVNNGWERFDDFGADGCPDAMEDGKGGCSGGGSGDANHDNFDPDTNPTGTENDWMYQQGEPFKDLGLDGVANTHDFGEGNGAFDMSSGRKTMLSYDARTNLRKLTPSQRSLFSVLGDGGIRDMFNLGLHSKMVMSLVNSYRTSPMGSYRQFIDIPGTADIHGANCSATAPCYNPWNHNWATKVPRDVLMLYGNDPPSDTDLIQGEGDHVGTAEEAVYRFFTLFNWAAASWPSLERPSTPFGGAGPDQRQLTLSYDSAVLGAKREYAIALPPGYFDDANKDKRYPVLYLGHGYGMEPKGFMATALLTDSYVTDTKVQFRPMIMVFPDGRCCFKDKVTGAKDCREYDDAGNDLSQMANLERECNSGTFYVNRRGFAPGDETPYGDAFFELMDYIDQNYRTLPAADVEAR